MVPNTPDTFLGIDRLYGAGTYHTLARRSVYIIGIGGVGSWVVESLSRTGVGQLFLADGDDVCVTNTNRQIHALANTIGRPKIDIMADRCRLISESIDIKTNHTFITAKNVNEHINAGVDLVIDCGDSQMAKAAVIARARRLRIPVITIGAAGGRVDPSRVKIRDLAKTYGDPLLASVRQTLRNRYGFSRTEGKRFSVSAVFSDEQVRYFQEDGFIGTEKPREGNANFNCVSALGAVTHLTASFAFHASARAIDLLLNLKPRVS